MTLADCDGWWWLPDSEEKCFGRITAQARKWSLDLHGDLDPPSGQRRWSLDSGPDEVAVIHGRLTDPPGPLDGYVTLFRCLRTRHEFGLGSSLPGRQRWEFDEFVTGPHNISDNQSIQSFDLDLGGIHGWAGHPGIGPRGPSLDIEELCLGTAKVANAEIGLYLGYGTTGTAHCRTVRSRTIFRASLTSPIHRGAVNREYVGPLTSLLSFLTLGFVDVEELTVTLAPSGTVADEEPPWSHTVRTRRIRPIEEPEPVPLHQMLATWHALQPLTMQQLLSGWFNLYEKLDKTIAYLLVPHHAPYLFVDDQVLTASIAVEDYHRTQIGGTPKAPTEFSAMIEEIVAHVPDRHKKWVREGLSGRNRKGQRKQVDEVIKRAGATGAAIVEACPKFTKLVGESRNKAAHPMRSVDDIGPSFLAVAYGLRWLLRHCLLVDMGIADEQTERLVASCQTFKNDLELIHRWTTSLPE